MDTDPIARIHMSLCIAGSGARFRRRQGRQSDATRPAHDDDVVPQRVLTGHDAHSVARLKMSLCFVSLAPRPEQVEPNAFKAYEIFCQIFCRVWCRFRMKPRQ